MSNDENNVNDEDPLIDKNNRPIDNKNKESEAEINLDTPLSNLKVSDLLRLMNNFQTQGFVSNNIPFPENFKEFNKPENFKPENFKPENFKPENFKPENFKPENFKPENFKPENFKPENFKPENFKPENFKPENFKPENFKPENFKPDNKEIFRPEIGRSELLKEITKAEPPNWKDTIDNFNKTLKERNINQIKLFVRLPDGSLFYLDPSGEKEIKIGNYKIIREE